MVCSSLAIDSSALFVALWGLLLQRQNLHPVGFLSKWTLSLRTVAWSVLVFSLPYHAACQSCWQRTRHLKGFKFHDASTGNPGAAGQINSPAKDGGAKKGMAIWKEQRGHSPLFAKAANDTNDTLTPPMTQIYFCCPKNIFIFKKVMDAYSLTKTTLFLQRSLRILSQPTRIYFQPARFCSGSVPA